MSAQQPPPATKCLCGHKRVDHPRAGKFRGAVCGCTAYVKEGERR